MEIKNSAENNDYRSMITQITSFVKTIFIICLICFVLELTVNHETLIQLACSTICAYSNPLLVLLQEFAKNPEKLYCEIY